MLARRPALTLRKALTHVPKRQLAQISPIAPKPRPFRTLLQCLAIAMGTVGCFVTYQVSQGKTCFLPFWVSKSKKTPTHQDVDFKYVKYVAEEQILERLSLHPHIQGEYRLPLKTRLHDDFEVWCEEKNVSVKGVEVAPGFRWELTKKPVNVKADFEVLMENLGGKERFEIPVVNANKHKEDDLCFLGTVTIEGQNGKTADVVFRGIFDAEHTKQARITRAHLIRLEQGKKVRERLWDH